MLPAKRPIVDYPEGDMRIEQIKRKMVSASLRDVEVAFLPGRWILGRILFEPVYGHSLITREFAERLGYKEGHFGRVHFMDVELKIGEWEPRIYALRLVETIEGHLKHYGNRRGEMLINLYGEDPDILLGHADFFAFRLLMVWDNERASRATSSIRKRIKMSPFFQELGMGTIREEPGASAQEGIDERSPWPAPNVACASITHLDWATSSRPWTPSPDREEEEEDEQNAGDDQSEDILVIRE